MNSIPRFRTEIPIDRERPNVILKYKRLGKTNLSGLKEFADCQLESGLF